MNKRTPFNMPTTTDVRNIDEHKLNFEQILFVFLIIRTIKIKTFGHICGRIQEKNGRI